METQAQVSEKQQVSVELETRETISSGAVAVIYVIEITVNGYTSRMNYSSREAALRHVAVMEPTNPVRQIGADQWVAYGYDEKDRQQDIRITCEYLWT